MMRKYEIERESRKKAAQASIENMSEADVNGLSYTVNRVLDRIATDLCLSEHGRALVLEYVKAAVGVSVAEAIIQGVEIMVGGMFE